MANNSQKLNSVLLFAGVKGNHLFDAVAIEVKQAIINHASHGNKTPFTDTKDLLTKATLKNGEMANNPQAVTLSALIIAEKASRTLFEQLKADGLNSKGEMKFSKKLTADDLALINTNAENLTAEFLTYCVDGVQAQKNTRADKLAIAKADKKLISINEKVKAEIAEREAEKEQAKIALDTFKASEMMIAISKGDKKALALVESFNIGVQAYKALQADTKANKVQGITTKAKKQAKDKLAHKDNKAINQAIYATS